MRERAEKAEATGESMISAQPPPPSILFCSAFKPASIAQKLSRSAAFQLLRIKIKRMLFIFVPLYLCLMLFPAGLRKAHTYNDTCFVKKHTRLLYQDQLSEWDGWKWVHPPGGWLALFEPLCRRRYWSEKYLTGNAACPKRCHQTQMEKRAATHNLFRPGKVIDSFHFSKRSATPDED